VVEGLEKQTNQKLEPWNRVVRETPITNEHDLRAWLTDHGVTGYAQTLLVMERFGYPDFLTATAEESIARQYEDRSHLSANYDAVIDAATECGAIIIRHERLMFRSLRRAELLLALSPCGIRSTRDSASKNANRSAALSPLEFTTQ